MIKVLLSDIDGVLTDGKVTFDAQGNETKTANFTDMDAMGSFRQRGVKIGLITGEKTAIVEYFKKRFRPDYFVCGCHTKGEAVKQLMEENGFDPAEVCYIGDGKYDLPVMPLVRVSACPANAIREVKAAVSIKLQTRGGDGVIKELLDNLIDNGEV
ncbi:MAG: HAD hydrolase family protein [Lentisphaeria bacterium]|nr:HAD hydrolase family protein [Lentisphaeria bacterium]